MILVGQLFIFILPPSHYHMLNITKEEENKNKNHTSIKKSDEDSFDCQDVMCI